MEKKITDQQIQLLASILLELPAKTVLQAIDLLRNLPVIEIEKKIEDDKKN